MDLKRGLEGLAFYRQRAGLTQQQLAEGLNVSRTAVTMWETGQSWPSAALLPRIADVLLCSIDELYCDHITEEEGCPCITTSGISTEVIEVLRE